MVCKILKSLDFMNEVERDFEAAILFFIEAKSTDNILYCPAFSTKRKDKRVIQKPFKSYS